MAQVKKEGIDKKILKAAKIEFLKHGFMAANTRNIAKRAKVTLSNLYNYYSDKNALFAAILKPELDDLERLCEYGRIHRAKEGPFETLQEKQQHFQIAIDYIDKHHQELDLLFNHSAGSKLENFSEKLVQEYENNWNYYFDFLREKFPQQRFRKPSSFFLRNMAHFHLMTVSKILDTNYSKKEMAEICEEIATFIWHGGVGLINLDSKQNIS